MSDKNELLPCPFCGSKAEQLSSGEATCENEDCAAFFIVVTPSEWNTRAAPAEDVRAMVDEPVAYYSIETPRVTIDGQVTEWFPALAWYSPEQLAAVTTTYRVIETLYRHAQRKVVMPERVNPEYFDSIRATGIGWNACLDEIERLNGESQ